MASAKFASIISTVTRIKNWKVNQYHCINNTEAQQSISTYEQDLVQFSHLRHLLLAYNNDSAGSIKPSPTRPASHLRVLARQQITRRIAVKLANGVEDDSARRHVDAHGKRLCGKQHLDETALEEYLHNLFHDGQHSTVVDAYATQQQSPYESDLQHTITTCQTANAIKLTGN